MSTPVGIVAMHGKFHVWCAECQEYVSHEQGYTDVKAVNIIAERHSAKHNEQGYVMPRHSTDHAVWRDIVADISSYDLCAHCETMFKSVQGQTYCTPCLATIYGLPSNTFSSGAWELDEPTGISNPIIGTAKGRH